MKRWVGIALVMLKVAGCGGGGDDGGVPMRTPTFNAAGVWQTSTEAECTGPAPYASLLERPASWQALLRIEQRGNHLEAEIYYPVFDETESATGTISGNQIHYERESEREGIQVTITGDATVLSAEHIGLTERVEALVQGEMVMVTCTVEYERRGDLTGRWVTTEIACDSFSSDLPQGALAELDGQLEYEALQSSGLLVIQKGNDLEITYLDSGERIEGTTAGDQIRYVVSEQLPFGDFSTDVFVEAKGTVLDADYIDEMQEIEWTFGIEGRNVTVSTVCTSRLTRVV